MEHSIFISYKRKSISTASLLHYRLTVEGYSAFFDIEDMNPGEFDTQIYQYIDDAIDIIMLIDKGSLDGWKPYDKDDNPTEEYKEDWFYKEISYAVTKNKNIVPILVDNCGMVSNRDLPADVRCIKGLEACHFSHYHCDDSISKLISKGFLKSKSEKKLDTSPSVFKIYSNMDCSVYSGNQLVCNVVGNSEDPFYWYIKRKGEYRLRCVNRKDKRVLIDKTIDVNEEKIVDIRFKTSSLSKYMISGLFVIIGSIITLIISYLSLNMFDHESGVMASMVEQHTLGTQTQNEKATSSTFEEALGVLDSIGEQEFESQTPSIIIY